MSEHFSNLTPAEQELLAMLAEEAGEVIQAIGKILRHGYHSKSPYALEEKSPDNKEHLLMEIGDFFAVVEIMVEMGHIEHPNEAFHMPYLIDKKFRWAHHVAKDQ